MTKIVGLFHQGRIFFFGFILSQILISSIFAQAPNETILFISINPTQWLTSGRVTFQPSDTTLRMLFSFDDNNPPVLPPDTTELQIASELDFGGYDSVFVLFDTRDFLPDADSWVDGTIGLYVKHEYQTQWSVVTDDLSSLAGWAHKLNLKLKVAVRSNPQSTGAFAIDNFRIVGKNR